MVLQKPNTDEEKHEWDRQPRETSRSYELFCVYRNLGPERSLAKARKSASGIPSVPRLKVLSVRWNWVNRARKYDDYLEYQERLQQEKERREMHKRHAKMGVLAQSLAVKALENLLNKVQAGGEVSAGDASRLLDTAVKVERLARGEATDIQKSEHTGTIEATYRSMSPAERRQEMQRIFEQEYGKTPAEAKAMVDDLMGRDDSGDNSGS